jgi:hypothetical protein
MSNIEYAKKLRRVRKFALENAARWERDLAHDPLLQGAIDSAKESAARYLVMLRELKGSK